ncbi:hypothetical protein CR513_13022, partial [Mucuna pruriens]
MKKTLLSQLFVEGSVPTQLQRYQKVIEIYEDIARKLLNSTLLKYGVREYLLNSGLCQLGRGDFVAIANSLELCACEYYFLLKLCPTDINEQDIENFIRLVKEYSSIISLDYRKSTLLLRAKDSLKLKEREEGDLTWLNDN